MKKKKLKYKNRKWDIQQTENGLVIYVTCSCGVEHDIEFDNKGKYIGSGQTIK